MELGVYITSHSIEKPEIIFLSKSFIFCSPKRSGGSRTGQQKLESCSVRYWFYFDPKGMPFSMNCNTESSPPESSGHPFVPPYHSVIGKTIGRNRRNPSLRIEQFSELSPHSHVTWRMELPAE